MNKPHLDAAIAQGVLLGCNTKQGAEVNGRPMQPDLMTEAEVIAYLRLDVDERDPAERLRNLCRRQGLPVVKRGRLKLFRKTSVDAWLEAAESGRKKRSPVHRNGK